MFSWMGRQAGGRERAGGADAVQTVTGGLRSLYLRKVLPLEEAYRFHEFHSPALEDADFENKPMILLVGQYSTGKTTFIRYLLEQDFPGMRIGPEPTTDSFIAVMYGETEGSTPGNALVVDPKKPFRKLSRFGNAFLNRFMCSQLPNQVLKSISIIDSPGILSGEKQRISRGYDFCQVLQWFAERVDRIILLFDAHKLDISDEFSEAIKAFRGQDDKIRVVLNKADQVDTQQLMRVYGALMWSLGKVINTPEVLRVYIGSFWAQPLQNTDNRRLFEAEAQDLFRDIQSLPQKAAVRKLNDLIKRARLAKVHAYIISYLKKEMPSVFGKENKKRELISRLPEIYIQLQREYQISAGDFPEVKAMQEQLENYDFTKFHSLKPKLIEAVDNMLSNKISSLMNLISQEEISMPTQLVQGGAFDGTTEGPFNQGYGEGAKEGADEEEWVVAKDKPVYDELFYTLSPINGKISGVNAKKEMVTSKLPNSVLGKIWKLADCDCDGMLDEEEFALAKHLIKIKLDGFELPNSLPSHLVPPSHRKSLPKAD
ncbi:EH domain-containing protein 4 [Manis pentadactyla]|uniref:EH domain-containing protein 4 n=1 Tax=Manis javanica TaxID=9974 RepID=UPI000812F617|nr:EH domain-containing protein 4 [Manis javanica]XP_036779657.1 EH domain-containing protein 4 [Manis pentadactyla]XP_036874744.1 EH domain-containing protein 4 [Manis javanica]KAI5278663.1 Eh Domain-Containing Protein 4 [Manis pentadactyla]KAI5936785.1 EH domain-containing protein 4 [Manis javanica]